MTLAAAARPLRLRLLFLFLCLYILRAVEHEQDLEHCYMCPTCYMTSHDHHRYEELMGTVFLTIWDIGIWHVFYFHHSSIGAKVCADELWWNICGSVTRVLFSSWLRSAQGLLPKTYDELGIFVIDVICSMTKFKMSYGKTSWMLLFLLVRGTIPNNSFSWENT